MFTSVPFTGASTFSIPGYTCLNHARDFTFVVVDTSFSAPPSSRTTWLFACHRSAMRSGLVGTVTSLPSMSLMTLVPSPLSFTKKLVCFFAELVEAETEVELEAEEEAVFAAPQPVRAASSREVVRAMPVWNFVIFMVCLSVSRRWVNNPEAVRRSGALGTRRHSGCGTSTASFVSGPNHHRKTRGRGFSGIEARHVHAGATQLGGVGHRQVGVEGARENLAREHLGSLPNQ